MHMHRRTFVTATAATAALAGCASDDPNYEDGDSNTGSGGGDDGASVEEDVVIREHELVREDEGSMSESVSVKGRAENTSDQTFSYVEVRARFYNEAGDMLDSMIDNINDLEPGQTWSFEIQYLGIGDDAAEVADYDIAVGTSF